MPYNNFRPFDMSKDFDTIQHNVLGNNIMLSLILSYLSEMFIMMVSTKLQPKEVGSKNMGSLRVP